LRKTKQNSMARTLTFIDFENDVKTIRKNILTEITPMLEPIGELDCIGKNVGVITYGGGDETVSVIYHDYITGKPMVKTTFGNVIEIEELNTDDMVAMYEHIHYRVNPDEK
jgi:hypothetical protein